MFKLFNRSKKKDSKAEAKEKTVATPHRADDNNFYVVSIPVRAAILQIGDDGTVKDVKGGEVPFRIVFYKVKESSVPGISKEDKR